MLLDLLGFVKYSIGIPVGGLGSLVGRGAEDVLAHDDDGQQDQQEGLGDPRDDGRPLRMASGRLIRARRAKAYAHHMVPTAPVILMASYELNRLTGLSVGSTSATRVGPRALRSSR